MGECEVNCPLCHRPAEYEALSPGRKAWFCLPCGWRSAEAREDYEEVDIATVAGLPEDRARMMFWADVRAIAGRAGAEKLYRKWKLLVTVRPHRACATCRAPIVLPSKRKNCSAECHAEYKRRYARDWMRHSGGISVERTCAVCGAAFTLNAQGGRYQTCSPECARERGMVSKRRPQQQPRPCRECGEDFEPRQERSAFCSRKCQNRWHQREWKRRKEESDASGR